MSKSRTKWAILVCISVGAINAPVSVLAQASDTATATNVAPLQPTNESPTDAVTEERLAWEAALLSGASADVFAFIEAYPNGQYINEARALMIDLLWTDLSDDSTSSAPQTVEDTASEGDDAESVETQDIELRSQDGFVALTGVIVNFDDTLITVQTSSGIVGIEREGIECIGSACPPELLSEP